MKSQGITYAAITAVVAVTLTAASVSADPITASSNSTFSFRDQRSNNSIGFILGDRNTVGISNVFPSGDDDGDGCADSDGCPVPPSEILATQGSTVRSLFFVPRPPSQPSVFASSAPWSNAVTGQWLLDITNGADSLQVLTYAVGNVSAMPFVSNMRFTGGGTTPTFEWTIPASANQNRVTVQIWDRQDFFLFGQPRSIFQSPNLGAGATSFTVPAGELDPNNLYSIAIQLDRFETRLVPGFGNQSRLVSRSRSWFDFSTDASLPLGQAVYLPMSNPSQNPLGVPVYEFNIDNVTPTEVFFIDPVVATGFVYKTGSGDPNFASVILPEAGDNSFTVEFNGTGSPATVASNSEYVFPVGGVSEFTVTGIEVGASIDPFDSTAFVTGLMFVGNGSFTGTMTPIVSLTDDIDIKPGSSTNKINTKSNGVVPVALFGSADLDVTSISQISATFGSTPAAPAHDLSDPLVLADHLRHVDGDGELDLILHFRGSETGLAPTDTDTCLLANTDIGTFGGCDTVSVK